MFNLTNNTLYVGSKEVINAYLGENLLFGPGGLEYPSPPTNYVTSGIRYGNFFGSGENIVYETSGLPSNQPQLVGNTSYEHNGLNVGTGHFLHRYVSGATVWSVVATFENDFSDMPNNSTRTIMDTTRVYWFFNDFHASIYKNSNGDVYVKTKDGTTAIPDEDTFQLSMQYSSTSWYGNATMLLSIYLNDTPVYYKRDATSFSSEVTLGGNIRVFNPGTVIYDIKGYATNLSVSDLQTNRNGIKELTFIKTN